MLTINNTGELMTGDIVLSVPNKNDIYKTGKDYSVRRFGVESINYEDNTILLFDLDNYEHFRWNRNVDILKGYHSLIVVTNVYN